MTFERKKRMFEVLEFFKLDAPTVGEPNFDPGAINQETTCRGIEGNDGLPGSVDQTRNRDIRTGDWRMINLQAPPFSFPPPLSAIDERCSHSGGRFRGKRLALWDLRTIGGLES